MLERRTKREHKVQEGGSEARRGNSKKGENAVRTQSPKLVA